MYSIKKWEGGIILTTKLMSELGLTIGLIVLYFIVFSSKKSKTDGDKGYYAFYSLMLIVLVVAVKLGFTYL